MSETDRNWGETWVATGCGVGCGLPLGLFLAFFVVVTLGEIFPYLGRVGFVTTLLFVVGALAGGWVGGSICHRIETKRMDEARQAEAARQLGLRIDQVKREAEERARREALFKAEREKLSAAHVGVQSAVVSLAVPIDAANDQLDLAEREFREGYFAPFWDAVEQAVLELGRYQEAVTSIRKRAEKYQDEATKLSVPAVPWELALTPASDARDTAKRLEAIVRQAQKDFQFAQIYEQRKTNQILVAGFGTLNGAIRSMHSSVEASLRDLAGTLRVSLDGLTSETRAVRREVEESARRLNSTLESQEKMLDDLRRGHKPSP